VVTLSSWCLYLCQISAESAEVSAIVFVLIRACPPNDACDTPDDGCDHPADRLSVFAGFY